MEAGTRLTMPHDVFLSYSHRDNEFPRGWVKNLYQCLNAAIAVEPLPEPIRVFLDAEGLRCNDQFHTVLESELRSAHVLLCVSSPAYNESNYCREELGYFVAQRGENCGELLHVQKKHMDTLALLEPFQTRLGYSFHEESSGFEYQPDDPNFERAVQPLARDVREVVKAARAPRQRVLVLASADREDERVRLVNDFSQARITAFPTAADPLPGTVKDRLARVKQLANEADFSVLLLGREYEDSIETAYDVHEKKWLTTPRRCLFGIPQQSVIEAMGSKQSAFYERVNAAGEAFDFCPRPEQIRPETCRMLRELVETARRAPTVFLYYRKSSRAAASALRAAIQQIGASGNSAKVVRVLDPYGDGDGTRLQTQTAGFDQALCASHGAVVIAEANAAAMQNMISSMARTFSEPVIAIYGPSTESAISPALTSKYSFLQPSGIPRYEWLPDTARVIELDDFLERIRKRATE